jgi:hypothetical protein
MKTYLIYLLLPLIISSNSYARSWVKDSEGAIYDKAHKKADLPTGGEFVEHPKKGNVKYYFINQSRMWINKENAQKHSGLYISEDSGETWKLLCYFFEFRELFIHPETGKLFSVIEYKWLEANKDGFLVPHSSSKALMSDDGKHWKDITGGRGYITDITGIIADPDNSGRVCLQVNRIRNYIFQAKDDKYSKWISYKQWDWPKRKEVKKETLN